MKMKKWTAKRHVLKLSIGIWFQGFCIELLILHGLLVEISVHIVCLESGTADVPVNLKMYDKKFNFNFLGFSSCYIYVMSSSDIWSQTFVHSDVYITLKWTVGLVKQKNYSLWGGILLRLQKPNKRVVFYL